MRLVKFNPVLPSFEGLMDHFFNNREDFNPVSNCFALPAANVKETDDAFLLELAAPGLKKEDFEVELEGDVLKISSEKKNEKETKDEKNKYTRKEFAYQSFSRTFILPKIIDSEKLTVNYEDGILRFHIPKKEESKKKIPKLIKIK